MLTVSSIAIGNALRAKCYYRQEALDKSRGTCTNNHAARMSIYAPNGKDILLARLYLFIARYVSYYKY